MYNKMTVKYSLLQYIPCILYFGPLKIVLANVVIGLSANQLKGSTYFWWECYKLAMSWERLTKYREKIEIENRGVQN